MKHPAITIAIPPWVQTPADLRHVIIAHTSNNVDHDHPAIKETA